MRPVVPLHSRTLPAGFIAPCLPTSAPQPPSGEKWLHEIKHDGFRVIARKEGKQVKLYSRAGNGLTDRFPLIVDALTDLRSRSCMIDGEAVACGDEGISSFDRIRYRRHDPSVFSSHPFATLDLRAGHWRRASKGYGRAAGVLVIRRASAL
jgi:bifunctional non-homologous end joining protein LigD